MEKSSQQLQKSHYPVVLNGEMHHLSAEQIGQIIRDRLKKLKSITAICDEFDTSLDCIDELVIEIVPLDQKYAESDINGIRLNENLFENGQFLRDYFFVVPHELVHWLSRRKEDQAYFHDPEETLGFVLSVAYEIENGTDFDTIWNRIYGKVAWHFHDENDAREFFKNMIKKAIEILNAPIE